MRYDSTEIHVSVDSSVKILLVSVFHDLQKNDGTETNTSEAPADSDTSNPNNERNVLTVTQFNVCVCVKYLLKRVIHTSPVTVLPQHEPIRAQSASNKTIK